jgi:hypothetical protein
VISPLDCSLGCAIANQATLYIATLVPALIIIGLGLYIANKIGYKGNGAFLMISICLMALSFASFNGHAIVPLYISILTLSVSLYSIWNNRRKGSDQ